MPRYDFKCKRCGKVQEFEHDMVGVTQAGHYCECKGFMKRVYSDPPAMKVTFREGHDPSTGKSFSTHAKKKKYMKDNNLVKG